MDHSGPRINCQCGSRVLELLYCETCGESYLGGFNKNTHDTGTFIENKRGFLYPSDLEFESIQSRNVNQRQYNGYVWYAPQIYQGDLESVERKGFSFKFVKALYDHKTGEISKYEEGFD